MTGSENEPENLEEQPAAKQKLEKKSEAPDELPSDQDNPPEGQAAQNDASDELASSGFAETLAQESAALAQELDSLARESAAALDPDKSKANPELIDEKPTRVEAQDKTEDSADAKPEVSAEQTSSVEHETQLAAESTVERQNQEASKIVLTQHHVSHLLADVLQDDAHEVANAKRVRFPMILDLFLGLGLLMAVGGFTIGLFHMYVVHSASRCISEQKYKAAIVILEGAPLPQVFARSGSDTEELLSKARYLDAMEKIEAGEDIEEALRELAAISPGSKYFALAQEAIGENTEAAPLMLEGGAETTESQAHPEVKETLLEKTLRE